ncbi:MAG: hypothetical protein PHT76_12745 [Anaerostipes sp.]|nr:hypothetical protein [Anaerostipes sp.]
MKDMNRLVEYIDGYIYVSDMEEIIIQHSENADEANRLYQYMIQTYKLENNQKWEFDIALDCVRNMNAEDRDYIKENPKVSEYHFGYGMYIRNHYIHCSNKHSYFEADNESSSVVEMILSILHPIYDFSNANIREIYSNWDYERLSKQYREQYSDIFDTALSKVCAANKEIRIVDSVVQEVKEELRKREGRVGFKKIFVEIVKECLAVPDKKYINQVWDDVEKKLYDKSCIYEQEYYQVKCMKVIDLYREVQGDIWGRTKFSSVDACAKYIEDTLGLKEDYAVFMAECAIEALKTLKRH